MSACNCCQEPEIYYAPSIFGGYRSASAVLCGITDTSIPPPNRYGKRSFCFLSSIHEEGNVNIASPCGNGFMTNTGVPCSIPYPSVFTDLRTEAQLETALATKLSAASWPLFGSLIFGTANSITYPSGHAYEGRYRLLYQIPPSCYLKVWLGWYDYVTFEEFLGAEPIIHEFTRTGNPCFTSSELEEIEIFFDDYISIPVAYHPSKTEWFYLPRNDATYLKILDVMKYSYLPDYEPDISDPLNPQPNGWPDPAWEPTPP